MQDCYKTLGVSQTATLSEIRHAYRQKAKLLHPDITHSDAQAFRELVDAYKTLSDVKTRALFDESLAFRNEKYKEKKKSKESFDYRKWLLERNDDQSWARLIIFDLLHNREDLAVQEFKNINMTRPNFNFSRWLSREDFMDYGFILAEELVLRQEYYDAVLILEPIIKMEYSYNYFRHFFPEVISLARHILRNNIEDAVNTELALDAWERALDLGFGNSDDSYFLQKMAEAYTKLGDFHTAQICREESLKLK